MRDILHEIRWKLFIWRINRPRWENLLPWFQEKSQRLRGKPIYAWRIMQFGDCLDGSASQKHMLCISQGWSAWTDTGLVKNWRREGRAGPSSVNFEFGGATFTNQELALKAYERG